MLRVAVSWLLWAPSFLLMASNNYYHEIIIVRVGSGDLNAAVDITHPQKNILKNISIDEPTHHQVLVTIKYSEESGIKTFSQLFDVPEKGKRNCSPKNTISPYVCVYPKSIEDFH